MDNVKQEQYLADLEEMIGVDPITGLPLPVASESDTRGAINVRAKYGTAIANLQAAADSLDPRGGTLYLAEMLGEGDYTLSGTWDLDGKDNLIIEGDGGRHDSGGFGTVLKYDQAGSGAMISAQEAKGLVFRNIQFIYTSSSFTGRLIDLRNISGSQANDTAQILFENCFFGAQPTSTATAMALVALANSHSVTFRDCTFYGADVAVLGREAVGDYANAILFDRCNFYPGQDVAHTKNAGSGWTYLNCVFESLKDGSPGAYKHAAGIQGKGVAFLGCWMGDTSLGSGAWINWVGHGLAVHGCRIETVTAGAKAIVVDENGCQGISITGNAFLGGNAALDFGATSGHAEVVMGPNSYDTVTARITGTLPTSLYKFDDAGLTVGGGLSVGGAQAAPSTPGGILLDRTGGDSFIRFRRNNTGAVQLRSSGSDSRSVLAITNDSGAGGAAMEFVEMTAAPTTPAATRADVYFEDNGSGKTRMIIKWDDGATTVVATQP